MRSLILTMFLLTFVLFGADVKIPIQGFLADANGIALNGTQEIKFTLFDSDDNGNVLWSNQDTASIQVENGEFSYMLGTTDAIDSTVLENATPLYLEIKIADEVLSPRIELGVESKSIYAYRAENSNRLEGKSLAEVKTETLGNILSRLEALETANTALEEANTQKDTKITELEGKIASLENASYFDGDYNNLTNLPSLFSGNYTDLTNQPTTITQEQVNAIVENTNGLNSNLTKITNLETKTEDMSIVTSNGYKTLRFSAVNVQVVNGTDYTCGTNDCVVPQLNGLGNLIVGYNEARTTDSDKTGSHNLVVGSENNYSSYGGSVFGYQNTITMEFSNITGGSSNTASGYISSVSGGQYNTASSIYSSISGGKRNNASGDTSSISGGILNIASGQFSSISGGDTNTTSARSSSVSGGSENTASGITSSVTGGFLNTASEYYSSVTSGYNNTASNSFSSVSGGANNKATQGYSSISGGYNNTASGNYSSVSGGQNHEVTGDYNWQAGDLFEDQ